MSDRPQHIRLSTFNCGEVLLRIDCIAEVSPYPGNGGNITGKAEDYQCRVTLVVCKSGRQYFCREDLNTILDRMGVPADA